MARQDLGNQVFRVLVVEPEDALRASMIETLTQDGLELRAATSFDESLQLLQGDPPHLIISDIDLPDQPGLELIDELESRRLRIPVIYLATEIQPFSADLPDSTQVRVVDRGTPGEEMRTIVAEIREAHRPRSSGAFSPFGVSEYLQLACVGQHSVEIEISDAGALIGAIRVIGGEVWSAWDHASYGEPAFQHLVSASSVQVSCEAFEGDPGDRNVEGSWQGLLLHAASQHDEAQAQTGTDEPEDHRRRLGRKLLEALDRRREAEAEAEAEAKAKEEAEARERAEAEAREKAEAKEKAEATARAAEAAAKKPIYTAADFDRIKAEATELLLSRKYEEALAAFVLANEIVPDHSTVTANITRLRELGYSPSSKDGSGNATEGDPA